MFKKFKDKLAEEVKSSPQRIQQFAQAAQAVVTSASSSVSDITNNDLFSIGDNDNNHRSPVSVTNQQSTFHEISLAQQRALQSGSETQDILPHEVCSETSRQRRLSNSSFASDISFRLPTYESPSMYHLQSDMDVSASEAEEKGFSGATVNLDRVTKEQLYSAYRRTQDRCTKYKTQYGDLARHYKLLERENAKARNVLVETQDKALRRISELREQCTLEQSAKAHLEKALRVEIEERNMKLDTLNMKLKFLQGSTENDKFILDSANQDPNENESSLQLIDLSSNEKQETTKQESLQSEVTVLNNKVMKLEQLLNKYKESLKVNKEKNHQMIAELQILTTDLENKNKENELLKSTNTNLMEAKKKIDELNNVIEKMQNTYNALEFMKNKEISVLNLDLEQAREEISQLNIKVEGLSKREEEYAISLAENKLSIHKELETKEAEIKSLKDSLSLSQSEIQSLNIVINDYKNNRSLLEDELSKLNDNLNELNIAKSKIKELELQLDNLTKKCQSIDVSKVKLDEEYKCLELQLKQETAEKLAMIDRNVYLENRNTQLSEDCLKKSSQINSLEADIKLLRNTKDSQIIKSSNNFAENDKLIDEVDKWKTKYIQLESEIQEEREELVKLQTEIEKLLCNHESIQTENIQLHAQFMELETKYKTLQEQHQKVKSCCETLFNIVKTLQQNIHVMKPDIKLSLEKINHEIKEAIKEKLHLIVSKISNQADEKNDYLKSNIYSLQKELQNVTNVCKTTTEELQIKVKEYDKLQSKLQEDKTECDAIKNSLNINLEQHNLLLKEMMTLKNEKQHLYDTLQLEIDLRKSLAENIKMLEVENVILNEKKQNLEENYNEMKKGNEELTYQIKLLEESKNTAEKIIEDLKMDKIDMEKETTDLLQKVNQVEDKNNKLYLENQNFLKKLSDGNQDTTQIKVENEKMLNEIKHFENRNLEIETEYNNLIDQMKKAESKNNEIEKQQSILHEKNIFIQDAKAAVEKDNQNLLDKLLELKTKYSTLTVENQELHCKLTEYLEQNSALDSENRTNIIELNKIKDSNTYLQDKVNIIKKQKEDDITCLEALRIENTDLKKKLQDYDINVLHSQDLEKDIKVLKSENMSLKNQCETISNNLKELEIEKLQVHNSHEHKTESNYSSNIYTQTRGHNMDLEKLTSLQELTNKSVQTNAAYEHPTHYENLHNSYITSTNLESTDIQHEYTLLKEENRRLCSDIEGLQTYLAKISKENSLLNDKLREVITSNDNFTDQSEISQYDIQALKNEIQCGKDKIDNLTRENMLLVEENLELKDQVHFQSSNKATPLNEVLDDKDISNINKKYNNVLESKNNLEKRVKELEYMNLSINNNMQEMQDNNERLRLSNDKLGMRLDEALVSLRHLHSLQENTELEYLRNILYEYLTGSGTHSLTLAKVLSAVVKFNESQTELVLQKERERQGILRHLGII